MYKSTRQKFWYNNIGCNKENVILTMSRHIENPDIVTTVYLSIFIYIQGYLGIFSNVREYWGVLRDTETNSGIIEAYGTLINVIFENSVITE